MMGLFGIDSAKFSAPYCPGTSSYESVTADGGKNCNDSGYKFAINKNGDCATENGCTPALTRNLACPGTSSAYRDYPDGSRDCRARNGIMFKIGSDGKCATETGCAPAVRGPVCPGNSDSIFDFPNGNRSCKGNGENGKIEFQIDANGKCITDSGCTAANMGNKCPGNSISVVDYPDGTRLCRAKKPDGSAFTFKLNAAGDCEDKDNCVTSYASKLNALGETIANAARNVKNSLKNACPDEYTEDLNSRVPADLYAKGANKVCKGQADSKRAVVYVAADGNVLDAQGNPIPEYASAAPASDTAPDMASGKKKSAKGKLCYLRHVSKGKGKKRVCMSAKAKARLIRGARKGGRNSHK